MRSLYLRIWLTVVAALALFALVSGWLVQRHLDEQRARAESAIQERVGAWAELLQRTLPPADAPPEVQATTLTEWSRRLRVPMALDDAAGRRLAASESYRRLEADRPDLLARVTAIPLDDGRTLWVPRPSLRRIGAPDGARDAERGGERGADRRAERGMPGMMMRTPGPAPDTGGWLAPPLRPPWLPEGVGLVLLLALLFLAVAAGAWPVVRRLTRRLEALKQGVEAFGAGALHQRVAEDGRDEVAALAASFNQAATRIEALLRSHQSLLANASHELRSPLARLKMAVAMLDDAEPAQRAALKQEITTNIGELDALVEEVLLASRLDAGAALDRREPVPLLALAAEEAARHGAAVDGDDVSVPGDERLLRRALRNLLENARRYGGGEVQVQILRRGATVELTVSDGGAGVPEAYRERIFEPFFRLPGHAEREGGVGLGLSLVRQIAERHGGSVRCEARAAAEGGGSRFVLALPAG
ncbi:MAG: HAMP domain-containing histidine kinase [Rubrivivax sp.]|nr:HAMP domain-containing histidine kinase [Rubrivivax sp.]